MSGKIIKLPTELRPVDVRCKDVYDCKHSSIIVDEQYRTAECAICNRQLDPIQVLLEMAYEYRTVDYKLGQMRKYEEKLKADRERRAKRQAKKRKVGK